MDAVCTAYFKACKYVFESGVSLWSRTSDPVLFGTLRVGTRFLSNRRSQYIIINYIFQRICSSGGGRGCYFYINFFG
nr:MAG TPA: hypothetical protein [Caudoviricetes sp.]